MTFWRDLEAFGDRPALISEASVVTSYRSLAAQAEAAASVLRSLLPPDLARPLVLIETANDIEPITAYLAALRAGWPVILAADGSTADDSRIKDTYRPNGIFRRRGGAWTWEAGDRRQHDLHADLVLMLSTSGSTGAPKLVRLSGRNLSANAASIAAYLEIEPDERAITTLPFHYSYGMSVLHTHLLCGASLVLTERSLVDEVFWDVFARHGATSMALVPFQFDLLDGGSFERRDLPGLRCITQAGGKLAEPVVRRYAALARRSRWKLIVMYGQTEAAPRMAYVPAGDLESHADTIGMAVPGGRFELLGADGQPIEAPNVAGELVYHGPNVMMGYATGLADLGKAPGPALLRTGDIAERTERGYYRITGRLSRFVKMLGLRISLDEIEQRLRAAGIAAYATGTDKRITVFVTGNVGLAGVRAGLVGAYGLSETMLAVEPLDAVPLLASGKIDYRILAERAGRLGPAERAGAGSLTDVFALALRGRPVDPSKSFVEHGGDSLGYLEVQLALTDRLGEAPPGWEAMPLGTLEALAPKPPPRWQRVGPDLICRNLALLAVIALHAIALPIAGGVHVLLMLTGYSLARFQKAQLLAGSIGGMLSTMLLPIVIGYYLILAGVQVGIGPVDPEWFALLGNFDQDINPHGITPYWFVCLYVQGLVLVALPFSSARVRRWAGEQPLTAGIAALAALAGAGFVLGLPSELGATAVRHPVMGLQLVALGWCVRHAESVIDRRLVAMLSVALAAMFLPAGMSVPVLLAGAVAAVLWIETVPLPSALAWLLTYVGKQSMLLYLAHVIVIAVLSRLASLPDALMLSMTLLVSLAAAEVIARAMQAMLRASQGVPARSQDA